MNDLKQKTLRGGFAKVCTQGANFVLRIASLTVLARLLDPKDFGLVGMVTAVTGVFSLFKDAGLSMATIQRSRITNEQVSTLFWINILVGVIFGISSLALAPVLVSFYHEPRLFWITVALATGFVFNAAGVQHSALLQRQMRFTTLSMIEIISSVASIAIGVCMAIMGYEYWALVGMAVLLPIASTSCLWLVAEWVPGLPRRGVGIGSMIRFGGTTTLNSLVVYVAYNLEKILLGRFWGTEALGIYGRAYQLINISTENLNSASGAVAFAALSRLQDDPNRFKSYFLKGYSVVLALTLPITIACALFANDIILILLGEKWKEAIPIFRLLAPTVLVFALINPMWWLLSSMGLLGRSLKIALVLAPLVIIAYLLGLPYGPAGVAFAYSAVMTLWVIPHIAWCISGTMISLQDLIRAASRPFISAIVAALLAYLVGFFFGQSLSPYLRLLLGGGSLLVSYLWMLLYMMGEKTFYVGLLQGLRGQSYLAKAIL